MMFRLGTSLLLCLIAAACGGGGTPRTGDASPARPAGPTATIENETASPGDAGIPPFEGRLVQVRVQGRNVSPDLGSVDVSRSQRVRIEVTADAQDEVHVHGYDRRANVSAGQTAVIEFEANIPGSFEVELEKARLKLFDLRVR